MGTDTIAEELDRLYEFEMDKYVTECDHWKKMGYKIYRNTKGQHKVVEPLKVKQMYNPNGTANADFVNMFAGTPFADFFGGSK